MFSREEGSTLILAMAFIFVFIIISTVMSNFIVTDLKTSAKDQDKIKVLNLAEAGIEEGIYNYKYYNNPSRINKKLGSGSYEVTFDDDIGNGLSRIKSVAYVNKGLKNEVKKELVVDLEVSGNDNDEVFYCKKEEFYNPKWEGGHKVAKRIKEIDLDAKVLNSLTQMDDQYFDKSKLEGLDNIDKVYRFHNNHQPKDIDWGGVVDLSKKYGTDRFNVFFADGDLKLEGIDKLKANPSSPAIIFVKSKFWIKDYVEIENVYIFTSDAAHINAPFKAKNFLLHSNNGSVEIETDLSKKAIEVDGKIVHPKGYINIGVADSYDSPPKFEGPGKHPSKIDFPDYMPQSIFSKMTITQYENLLNGGSGGGSGEKEIDIISRTEI